jgi:hypothetical protein
MAWRLFFAGTMGTMDAEVIRLMVGFMTGPETGS